MLETIVPIALFLSGTFLIVAVTRIISEGRTRRRLIEAGATPELAAALSTPTRGDPALQESLRWGLVLGGVGIALIILQFLPYRSSDPISLGLVLVFAAAGLLVYYAAARRTLAQAR